MKGRIGEEDSLGNVHGESVASLRYAPGISETHARLANDKRSETRSHLAGALDASALEREQAYVLPPNAVQSKDVERCILSNKVENFSCGVARVTPILPKQ